MGTICDKLSKSLAGCNPFLSPQNRIINCIQARNFDAAINLYEKYRPQLTDYEYDVLTLCLEGNTHDGDKRAHLNVLIDDRIKYDQLLNIELLRQKNQTSDMQRRY